MRRFFYLFLIILFISSCAEEDPPLLVYDIEDDFSFKMKEGLRETGRDFHLEISTIPGYGCEDTQISVDFYNTAAGKEISINDLHIPDNCGEGDFRPVETLNFGGIAEGTYEFNINLQSVVFNQGTLTIWPEGYSLEFLEKLEGGQLAFGTLNRIPDGMVWGRLEYEGDQGNFLLGQLHTLFATQGAGEALFPQGQYTDFHADNQGGITWDTPTEHSRSLSFSYTHEAEDEQIYADIIENFMETYGEDYTVKVSIFTSKGGEY